MATLSQATGGVSGVQVTGDHTALLFGCSRLTLRLQNGSRTLLKHLHQLKNKCWGSTDIPAHLWVNERETGECWLRSPLSRG